MNGIISDMQFTRETGGGLALANTAQQQNHLARSQVFMSKDRACIDRVHALTLTTTMLRDAAALGSSEVTRLLNARATLWTVQASWMKVLAQPDLAQRIVANVENWKIHVPSVVP